ncbi:MAG TPA: formate/nitrite transporter family protein, partial [Kaistia sp.]|nr:formate/nitrite transporter family protein [Kaistia sp.]
MFDETISKLSALGASKARLLETNPAGFFIGSAMAGIYVGFGILLIFSLGSLLDPSIRPLVMGASFGLALILVVFAGAELYTGHTMNMTISTLEGQTTLGQ